MQQPALPNLVDATATSEVSSPSPRYESPSFDEVFFEQGEPRALCRGPLESLDGLGGHSLSERQERLRARETETGFTYGGSDADAAAPFEVDMVPGVLDERQWQQVQAGVEQRTRALNAFLEDVYGEGRILHDGLVPRELVEGSAGYAPDLVGRLLAQPRAIVCGFDIIRNDEGRFMVLEDNLRVPSGIGYAIGIRALLEEVLPEMYDAPGLLDPALACKQLMETFRKVAPRGCLVSSPQVVIVVAPDSQARFAIDLLSDRLGVPRVYPDQLHVRGGVLFAEHQGGLLRVDVAYLRTHDSLHIQHSGGEALSTQLVRCADAGNLTLVNPWGNGVADDKAIYAYVPKMIEYYLNEVQVLEQVPTYLLANDAHPDLRPCRLKELVVKPTDGCGGQGVTIGPRANDSELEETRRNVETNPEGWVAQDVVCFSTHPCLQHGHLVPRHVDLRVFSFWDHDPVVPPCPLTRIAPFGSMVVNSGRGGGIKDTWIKTG